jgi:hypothetical protein
VAKEEESFVLADGAFNQCNQRRIGNRQTEPIFGNAAGREMEHVTRLLWQL